MSRSFKGKVIVTERDQKLFEYLFSNKVATSEDLRMDIFNSISKQAVHRRLSKLINHKFVDVTYLRQEKTQLIYSLSKKAVKEYLGNAKNLTRLQTKSASLLHDLELVKIKRRFLKLDSVINYLTENELICGISCLNENSESLRSLGADAIVEIQMNGQNYLLAVEFEASTKTSHRYEKLIKKYDLCDLVQGVLYISKIKNIQNRVRSKEMAMDLKNPGRLFYCLIDDILKESKEITFINARNESLVLS